MRETFSAYYYGFLATGVLEIDAILKAVAHAGKAYHHTEEWSDTDEGEPSEADKIQKAADHAASVVRALRP